ncbi:mercuric reductase [Candidatus Nitronereus thalassa]|uniref:Mercuric reductase n=1 Tax=Candidatus Nitronereus thalassa TaxID=3020898 RepID=A0ABU3KCW8_9BACT|nr:mercuric reductase [Candidatus Nitronereus thalassa]MDT7044236.1 mercuric reductase [Candidatus Nitronereus thalassa]
MQTGTQRNDLVEIPPMDEFNHALINNVHPPTWFNPEPTGRYNLVVIGAGTAGLVTAAVAAAVGAKVALIERHLMGGDCLNVGCVPSKGVIRASRVWAEIHHAAEFGLHIPQGVKRDFGTAMARMRKLRAKISHVDSAHRYKGLGVDVFIGEGRFAGPGTVEVAGKTLEYAKAVICTGARAAAPPIPGLEEAGYLTNETIFSLTELPPRLAVIGAGPIGCEMAQSFTRFGSQVCLFERTNHILPREDADAAEIVQKQMSKEGQCFVFNSNITNIETRGQEKIVHFEQDGENKERVFDEILVGIGRAPNVENLGLDTVGVEFDKQSGVKVNSKLQTSNPKIYAAGDICFPFKFTHAADAMAQIVIQNALFPHPFGLGYASTDSLIIPWATYTDPEIAHVGLYEQEAKEKGLEVDTFTFKLDEVDRAILDGEDEGFARVHIKKGTDTILGATIVAAHAGDMISEITLAMKGGLGLSTITGTIHPYPTQAEVIKKVANAWRKTTFTEGKKKFLTKLFARMR